MGFLYIAVCFWIGVGRGVGVFCFGEDRRGVFEGFICFWVGGLSIYVTGFWLLRRRSFCVMEVLECGFAMGLYKFFY